MPWHGAATPPRLTGQELRNSEALTADPRVVAGEGGARGLPHPKVHDVRNVPHNLWTDEERAMLRRLRANGLGAKRIGLLMGRTKGSVDKQLRYLELSARRTPVKPRQESVKRVRGAYTLPPLPSLASK